MEKYFDVLRKTPLFFGLSDGELRAILSCLGADVLTYERRNTVFFEGERGRYIYIVLFGKIQLEMNDYYGNRSIISAHGPTELFAEAFACVGSPSMPVAAVASEESGVMLIPNERILHTCERGCSFHRQVIYNLMREMAEKNIVYHRRLEVTSKRTTRDKLLTYLLLEAKRLGTYEFDIPFDRQELADYLEVDRSGLCSEIGKLVKEGAIRTARRRFKLIK